MHTDTQIVPRGRSIADAMIEIGVSRQTINRLLASGKLRAVKVGSKTMITTESIDDFWRTLPTASFRLARRVGA